MSEAVLSITGMHRSGTSLVASWLETCGLPIHHGRVWGPAEGNDLGHFEDIDFEELHRGVILDRWPSSRGWLAENPVVRFKRRERRRATSLVADRAALPVWGWKDPRSLLFLDEWMGLIPDLQVLVVTRPRAQVIDSLLRRAAIATNPHMRVTEAEADRAFDVYSEALERARDSFGDLLLVVALDQVVHDDRAVFDELQTRMWGTLRYEPIRGRYRADKLQS